MSLFTDFTQCFYNLDLPQEYQRQVNRLVETQEFSATTTLVDDLDEQFELEQMLEGIKPRYRQGTQGMHYLLKTPFRYPPLKHGSRFGTRLLPSFFYAAEHVETTLAEVAYYRFVFLSDMQRPYDKVIKSEHLMYWVDIHSTQIIDLSGPQLTPFASALRDPADYRFCQQVGQWLTQQIQVDGIRYASARSDSGCNLALYSPDAIVSAKPYQQQNWLCLSQSEQISFVQHGGQSDGQRPIKFLKQQFMVHEALPRPA